VHELVSQDVLVLPAGAGERKNYPPREAFRHSSLALGNEAGDHVGLLEIDEAVVQDHLLPALDAEAEGVRVARVPRLQHPRGLHHGFGPPGIVIDEKVLRGEHVKVDAPVLDLVPVEVLRPDRRRDADEHPRERRGSQQRAGLSARCPDLGHVVFPLNERFIPPADQVKLRQVPSPPSHVYY
jgi:hypothetical protein